MNRIVWSATGHAIVGLLVRSLVGRAAAFVVALVTFIACAGCIGGIGDIDETTNVDTGQGGRGTGGDGTGGTGSISTGGSGGSGGMGAGGSGSGGAAPACGDGACNGGETCSTCPGDCGDCPPGCGDGACNGGETCSTCPDDCGACPPVCGNGVCEAGESCGNCAGDCAGPSVFFVNPGENIQAAMNQAEAYAKCISPTWPNHAAGDSLYGKVVLNPGVHSLPAPLATRAHIRIEAQGAEVVRAAGSHIMRVDNNGGGGYNAPPYWTIVGGVWNANGGGGFSVVHTRKFVLWDMEIKNIGYKAHHLEINSSGGEYQAGVYNVVVHNVTMHGVAQVHRIDDEAINIDYSWAGAAYNVAGDGTVTNNVLIRDCQFYDVPRAVSSHHFQVAGGAPVAEMSGITIQGGSFHDIDPSLAESGGAYENDGAIRVYGWQNVLIENVTFTNCATAVSVYAPSDFPPNLGAVGNFIIRNNTFVSCGRAKKAGSNVNLVHVESAASGTKFWDVQITGNKVAGDWIAGTVYFVAVYNTNNCTITGNNFAPTAYGLASEKAHNKYTAQGSTNTGTFNLSNNTVSDGSVDNS